MIRKSKSDSRKYSDKGGFYINETEKMECVRIISIDKHDPHWHKCKECNEQGCFLCNTDHDLVREILKGYYGNNKKELKECMLYKPYLISYKYMGRRIGVDFKTRKEMVMFVREKVRKEMVQLYRAYVREKCWDTFWFITGRCPRCEDPTIVEGKCNIPNGVRENARCIYSFGIDPEKFLNSYNDMTKMFYGFILLIKRR